MALLCHGCDAQRETIRAFCLSCEEVTESYEFSGAEDAPLPAIISRRWSAEPVNLPARLDAIAARNAAGRAAA